MDKSFGLLNFYSFFLMWGSLCVMLLWPRQAPWEHERVLTSIIKCCTAFDPFIKSSYLNPLLTCCVIEYSTQRCKISSFDVMDERFHRGVLSPQKRKLLKIVIFAILNFLCKFYSSAYLWRQKVHKQNAVGQVQAAELCCLVMSQSWHVCGPVGGGWGWV